MLTGAVEARALGAAAVGGDLSGLVAVTGPLGRLDVLGATLGPIVAGDVGIVTVRGAHGPLVLQIDEGGVARRVAVTPAFGSQQSINGVRFSYVYDSTVAGRLQLSTRVFNGDPSTRGDDAPFDLGLYTNSAATFDLVRLDAAGRSDLHNLVVEGNLHSQLTPVATSFLGLPAGSPGGVWLPLDRLGAVAVRANAEVGSVRAAGIGALAFGALAAPEGRSLMPRSRHRSSHVSALLKSILKRLVRDPRPASATSAALARIVLRTGTRIDRAEGRFTVPIGTRPVSLFLGMRRRHFDRRSVLFTNTHPSTQVTAVVDVAAPASRVRSEIRSIQFHGQGGIYRTAQPVGTAALVDAVLADSLPDPVARRKGHR